MTFPKRVLLLAVATAALALVTAPIAAAASRTAFTKRGAWSFVSAPSLHPPKLKVIGGSRRGLVHGLYFLANFKNITIPKPFTGQAGPLIVDRNLNPVWFLPAPSGQYANNLRVQRFDGKPALSWWQGVVTKTGATLSGEDIVVDQHYNQIATLTGADGWVLTQHEMIIDGHNAWVTANKLVTSGGTKRIDSAVQEYDLTTGKLLVNWDALQHIPVSQSHWKHIKGVPDDTYHVNSIQLVAGGTAGQFLVSMRNTWAAYLVDIASGNIVWTLGGSQSSFKLPKKAQFQWQHDVELHSGNLVSVFDDACCQLTAPGQFAAPNGPSRGLLLRLDTSRKTASYVAQFVHPPIGGGPLATAFQGNAQFLRGGHVLIGWGSAPFFSEFSKSGKLLLDVELPSPDVTYRAYLASWVGLPSVRDLHAAVRRSHGKVTLYASWNGATEVASWRVLAGAHPRTVATARKAGFETRIRLRHAYKKYEVEAVDRHGKVIGTRSFARKLVGGY